MANKGSPFERDISRQLSLWWTGGKDDSCFWRTSQSGGRATTRRKKGKQTRGHAGDITNTDSTGEPLIKFITFELKRGYNRLTPHDMLDASPRQSAATVPGKRQKASRFDQFIVQAVTAAETAGTPYWMLIHKRDQREPVCFFPEELLEPLLSIHGGGKRLTRNGSYYSVRIKNDELYGRVRFVGVLLKEFLAGVDPANVKSLYRQWRKKNVG